MKIAVVGTGISGLVAAYLLAEGHDITVFEANGYVGGHANTVSLDAKGSRLNIDTGFVVFNQTNYPNFCNLLGKLDVASQASDMSFSVSCERTGLEYRATTLNTLFAQRRNLFRPTFHRMLRQILRFNRESPALLAESAPSTTLGDYLDAGGYSRELIEHYIIPMGSAIWSAGPEMMKRFPADYFVQFFKNHGFLSLGGMNPWRTITGGSQSYVRAITASFRDRIRLNSPVRRIVRFPSHVEVATGAGTETFDRIVIATHSDQALALLADPSPAEREVLGAIPYQSNETVLHTDQRLLPRTRRAWASWNYHIPKEPVPRAAVTYNMNMLQSLRTEETLCVTLNRSDLIRPEKVVRRFHYHHPVYTFETLGAQKRYGELNGVNRTYYCGAYWGYGFHEDGVKSALAVAERFGRSLQT